MSGLATAAILGAAILAASTISVEIGISVALIELTLGVIAMIAAHTPVSIFVLNITTMVGLGVGIDYSLLIVTRFREELSAGLAPHAAAEAPAFFDIAAHEAHAYCAALECAGMRKFAVISALGGVLLLSCNENRAPQGVFRVGLLR